MISRRQCGDYEHRDCPAASTAQASVRLVFVESSPAALSDRSTVAGDGSGQSGADLEGRVEIDWGVYGVPETYVIDQSGTIRFKQIGPITVSDWQETLWPLIQELQREP